jgi:hypothetical protein
MSVDNFIPELWASGIQENLDKSLVYASLCNRKYEGQIKEKGDTVHIKTLGPISNSAYTGTVVYQELNDAELLLKITEQRVYGFAVDDVDKAQADGDFVQDATANAAYGLRDTADQFIASLYTGAGAITAVTPANSLNAHALLLTLAQTLDEQNVPTEGRFCVIPPWFKTKLVLAKLLVENTSNDAWTNGMVGRVAGFDIYNSNNVPTTNGGTEYKIIAGVSRGWTYAEQLVKTETVRREATFGDGVRGLHVYGAKITDSDCFAVLDASILAEP